MEIEKTYGVSMTKKDFLNLLEKKILILDGATGTELQKRGLPNGVCPEKWVIDNPETLIAVQRSYKEAGSNIVYSCSFGANQIKLEEFDLQDKVYEMNKRLAEISREAVGKDTFVAGDMSPTGMFVEPFGDLSFEDAVNCYKSQAKGLLDGGVDLFVIETMLDIQETRAAVIAIREICDLPIMVSMTFQQDGYTLTGTDPLTALITLQSLGVTAFGCNCSTGPKEMLEIIKKLKPFATIPLLAKPNAGLPQLIDGKTCYTMDESEFATYVPHFAEAGVNLFGGCCGTTPLYIKASKDKLNNIEPISPVRKTISALSSSRGNLILEDSRALAVIGERINPTGKKMLQAELKEGSFNLVKEFAFEQERAGASVLDVNMGMSGIDEKSMMLKSIDLLSRISKLPLSIDSSYPDVIESALRLYPGRALINSISCEESKLEKLLEIASKYGAIFILLPLDDSGIPETAEERITLINRALKAMEKYGLDKSSIVVDGIVMTVSTSPKAANESLKLINWVSSELKANTVLGLSNVSFGLPERRWVNSTFLSMGIYNGLTMAIMNPNEDVLMNAKFSSDLIVGRDIGSKDYISRFSAVENVVKQSEVTTLSSGEKIFKAILDGDKSLIETYISQALDENMPAKEIVDKYLISAINKVGDLYDKKIYFLPQLISSAEAMKRGFTILEPKLAEDIGGKTTKEKIIIATVKGDIHDIGKNIVALMLKNYGFDVIDLGKDVSAEAIIETAKRENVKLIGLSALMTTTMVEMKNVIELAKKENLSLKFMIGGAVITEDYAKEIMADGYAKDSVDGVKVAKTLLGL